MIPGALWLPHPEMAKQGPNLQKVHISGEGGRKVYSLFIIYLPMSHRRLRGARDICFVTA